MNNLPKIAAKNVTNRKQTPILEWFREKLLAVERNPRTPPPGITNDDGETVYHPPGRFPNTQAARTQGPPNIPGGPAHKIATNYYFERDARRDVSPPTPLYQADASDTSLIGKETIKRNIINSAVLDIWTRSIREEEFTQRRDKMMSRLQKYDGYRS